MASPRGDEEQGVRHDPANPAGPAGLSPAALRAPVGGQVGQPPSGPIRVPRWAYWVVTLVALALGAEAIVRGTRAIHGPADSDLTGFFLPSVDYILRGDPFHLYAVRAAQAYPNWNPPLSMFLMAPLLAAARAVGFAANLGEQITFVSLPFILLIPVLGFVAVRALARLYPELPEAQRFLAYVLVVCSPLIWVSVASWGHLEQPLMLCFLVGALLALNRGRDGLAGLLAGLALLSRTTAIFPLLALGLLLLCERRWRTAALFGGIAAAVTAAGFAPFLLVDRGDTLYAFVSWRGKVPIGSNSIWTLFAYTGSDRTLSLIDAVARRADTLVMAGFLLAVALLAWRRKLSAVGRDGWAVAALGALAVPLLVKASWPYYYAEPFVLLLIWEFATMHDRVAGLWRWPVITVGYLTVTATLIQYTGLQSVGTGDRIVLGLLEFGVMAGVVLAIWKRLGAAKQVAPVMNGAVPAAVGYASPATPSTPSTPSDPWSRSPGVPREPASFAQPGAPPRGMAERPAPAAPKLPWQSGGDAPASQQWQDGQTWQTRQHGQGMPPVPNGMGPLWPADARPGTGQMDQPGQSGGAGTSNGVSNGIGGWTAEPSEAIRNGHHDAWPDLDVGWPPLPPAPPRRER
jgi:glycosyl transferase family 87